MNRLASFSILAAVALVVGCAGQAGAQPQAWDQAAATSIGNQLAVDSDAWREALRRQPDSDVVGSGESSQFDDMLRKSETIREMAKGLSAHLAAGDGMAKTKDMFDGLKEVVDDTAVDEERSFIDKPTLEAWRKVKGDVNKLAPYYGVKPSEP